MNKSDLNTLYAFNNWATSRVLEACSGLPQEEFTRDLGTSHNSVKDTLVHTMAAEWIWLERWQGRSPASLLDPLEFSDAGAVEIRWDKIRRDYEAFIATVTDESLLKPVSYEKMNNGGEYTFPLWQMMQHVVNHSSYHRGQIAAMFRQLGRKPVPTDMIIFHNETNQKLQSAPAQ